MNCLGCSRLPVFGIQNYDYASDIKSVDFHFAPMQDLMATLPYPHRHDYYQFMLVEHGSGHHIVDSIRYDVRPGTLFFLSPGEVHDFVLSSDTRGFTISFSAEFFALQLQNKNALKEIPIFDLESSVHALYPDDAQLARIRNIVLAIRDEYFSDQLGWSDAIRSHLYLLLLQAWRIAAPDAGTDQTTRALAVTRRFKALVESEFTRLQEASDYARLLQLSERSLTESVRRTTGMTASKLIRERVMLEAKRMLLHSDASVGEVAERLTFEDPAYFSRCFKKHTGRSPLGFRKDPSNAPP